MGKPEARRVILWSVGGAAGTLASMANLLIGGALGIASAVSTLVVIFTITIVLSARRGGEKTPPRGWYLVIAFCAIATAIAASIHTFVWNNDWLYIALAMVLPYLMIDRIGRGAADAPIPSDSPHFFVGMALSIPIMAVHVIVLGR